MEISKIIKIFMVSLKDMKISKKLQNLLTHSFSDIVIVVSPRVMRYYSLLFKNRGLLGCILHETIKIVNLIAFLFSAVDCKIKRKTTLKVSNKGYFETLRKACCRKINYCKLRRIIDSWKQPVLK